MTHLKINLKKTISMNLRMIVRPPDVSRECLYFAALLFNTGLLKMSVNKLSYWFIVIEVRSIQECV